MQNPKVWTLECNRRELCGDSKGYFVHRKFDVLTDKYDGGREVSRLLGHCVADDVPLTHVALIAPLSMDAGGLNSLLEEAVSPWEYLSAMELSVNVIASLEFLRPAAEAEALGFGHSSVDPEETAVFCPKSKKLVLRLRGARASLRNFPKNRCRFDPLGAWFWIAFTLDEAEGLLSRRHLLQLCGGMTFNFSFAVKKDSSYKMIAVAPQLRSSVQRSEDVTVGSRILYSVPGSEVSVSPGDDDAESFFEWLHDLDFFPDDDEDRLDDSFAVGDDDQHAIPQISYAETNGMIPSDCLRTIVTNLRNSLKKPGDGPWMCLQVASLADNGLSFKGGLEPSRSAAGERLLSFVVFRDGRVWCAATDT